MNKLVEFEKIPGYLRIRLLPEGKEYIDDYRLLDPNNNKSADEALRELLEWQLCNGWEWIWPEEIAALTEAPILTDDCERNEHGKLIRCGHVYWHERYQVEDPIVEMCENGFVDFNEAREQLGG